MLYKSSTLPGSSPHGAANDQARGDQHQILDGVLSFRKALWCSIENVKDFSPAFLAIPPPLQQPKRRAPIFPSRLRRHQAHAALKMCFATSSELTRMIFLSKKSSGLIQDSYSPKSKGRFARRPFRGDRLLFADKGPALKRVRRKTFPLSSQQ